MKTYTLLPHQKKAKDQALKILDEYGVVYLAGEVRTGKTGTAIQTAYDYVINDGGQPGDPHILILTSKKAIPSIKGDIKAMRLRAKIEVINYESVHKVKMKCPDVLILDEAHRLGKFPKPAKTAKVIKKMFEGTHTIIMSGTPSPESYSQLFHQFWCTGAGPWSKYQNFYKWAKKKVNITQEYIGMGHTRNNYSDVKKSTLKEFDRYKVMMTQKDAGFDGKVLEKIHTVKTPKEIIEVLKRLKRTQLHENPELEADTAAKLSGYFHQIASGTVIDIEKNPHSLSKFKVDYVKQTFKKSKLAIFYVYKQEGELLKKAFKNWTSDSQEFNKRDDLVFICQVSSGREGVNLSTADDLVFFNISYSAVSYWQARARSQSRKGGNKRIHWIFSDTGIEQEIYNTVQEKTDFTTKHFKLYARKFRSEGSKKMDDEKRLVVYKTSSNRSNRTAGPHKFERRRKGMVHRNKKARW